jgi:hypothetical protein
MCEPPAELGFTGTSVDAAGDRGHQSRAAMASNGTGLPETAGEGNDRSGGIP